MFRNLRNQVSSSRRILALGLLFLFLALGAWAAGSARTPPGLLRAGQLLLGAAGAYVAIRCFTYLLLDPLLSHRRNAVPGFARDLVVVALYVGAAGVLLHRLGGLDLGALLGTGAIAAAVVGLSLQETLGNLFAGISLNLDQAFRVGDWVEITGNLRGPAGQETFIGQVETMTWRSVQMITDSGDTTVFPNRIIAQAVVTNLYAPAGLHRRSTRVTIEPHGPILHTLAALEQALSGIPHLARHRPEVVTHSFELGGVVLELRWWAMGWRHGRAANFQAVRLAQTVLNRLGVPLLGPHGATTPHLHPIVLKEGAIKDILRRMGLPQEWAQELQEGMVLRRAAPGEGVIREGDPGESLFMVMTGSLQVVKVAERSEPYTGLFWDVVAELGPGTWFGEASLLTGAPRNATVVASAPCELVELPKPAFERCLKSHPQVVDQLVDLMAARAAQQAEAPRAAHGRDVWLAQIRNWFRL